MPEETFTKRQIIVAIDQWLDFGEQAYRDGYQKGYFSGAGWAASCLRYHLKQLEESVTSGDKWSPEKGGAKEPEKGKGIG